MFSTESYGLCYLQTVLISWNYSKLMSDIHLNVSLLNVQKLGWESATWVEPALFPSGKNRETVHWWRSFNTLVFYSSLIIMTNNHQTKQNVRSRSMAAELQSLHLCELVNQELSFQPACFPTLIYVYEMLFILKRRRWQVWVAEMCFFHRVAWLSCQCRARSLEMRESLSEESSLLRIKRIQRGVLCAGNNDDSLLFPTRPV